MPQKSIIQIRAAIEMVRTADFENAVHRATIGQETVIPNGTTDGLADLAWVDQGLSIPASGQQLIDLAGALIDQLGQAINFARITGLVVRASDANVNDVILGNPGANGFVGWFGAAAHTLAVKPGGTLALIAPRGAGYPVTAGTADILRLANGGAGSAVVLDVGIIGKSV